ncbi:MAG TPA: hypothetical protein VHR42_01990 [Clostridia bacterium]|nr:hypothetical protein [Clostridia bacterium]
MKKFISEQDSAAKPPEPQGERTPAEADESLPEYESGEELLDETMEELQENEDTEEPIEWDGSEAELVADEDAAEYEEQNTGIQLKYVLKSQEIFRVLFKTQMTPKRTALTVTAALLGVALGVYFLIRTVNGDHIAGSPGAICLILAGIILASPVLHIRSQAKNSENGKEIRMKIYPDHIQMGRGEGGWEIPLDGTVVRNVLKGLIFFYIDGNRLVILPLRCVEPSVLPEVQAMIFAGTSPSR